MNGNPASNCETVPRATTVMPKMLMPKKVYGTTGT